MSSLPLAHAFAISGLHSPSHLPSPVHARLRLAVKNWSEKKHWERMRKNCWLLITVLLPSDFFLANAGELLLSHGHTFNSIILPKVNTRLDTLLYPCLSIIDSHSIFCMTTDLHSRLLPRPTGIVHQARLRGLMIDISIITHHSLNFICHQL